MRFPGDWLTWVAGVDWIAYARNAMENMGSADDVFEMPLCRFVVLHFGKVGETVTKITCKEDLVAWRAERAKNKRGG